MKRAFILTLDTQGDTDFIGLAGEVMNACEDKGMQVLDCKPWSSPLTPAESTLPPLPTPKPPTLPQPPTVNFNLPPS